MQFVYDGYRINILDTPGHQDFSEDTYRTLMAADSAVMVIDASKGVEAQTRQSLANVQAILDEAGFAKSDVVKTTVFIRDMSDFATVNAIYADFFGDSRPARSCVEVARLPKDGLVEIEFVAVK